ncbi:hypothetical protein SAMN05444285_108108 [Draconibacterium orientale]|jgi:hypothetical protein|uniref:Lipoprotein n=1 Tax=Draconibacterium orientale TaxID=1168034 RepID=X5E2D8_9BACT|nr:hypothetical protein [Draconibacterium orientale]AHW61625.1 hypothetical protein FH5T_05275 [Draconibacterium orientale]SET24357.1 hypothetical protein SAMN05444285_108108 [Draconibacterium orientale]
MKTKILLVFGVIFLTLSCEKEGNNYIKPLNEISACGYDDPLNQLDWLKSKIIEGKDPSKTSFIENAWIKEYEEEDIVVVDFGLTSSMFSTFNCSGESITIDDQSFYDSLGEEELIYKYE